MKYNYIKPQVRVHEVRLTSMIAESVYNGTGDFSSGGEQGAREDFGWDDDDSWGDGWKK
ncbi:MAG: hypothetical protein HUK03_04900 [Bacteroidaceae bacterium]|nr:hypothetical protein [Bacteroidaceae bacterium]